MVRAPLLPLSVLAVALAACGTSRDVSERGEPIHADDFVEVHASEALADLASCRTCHGTDLAGALGPSCATCHDAAGFANWQANCTFCHGRERVQAYTAADLAKAAPATGAHVKHVSGGLLGAAISCEQCHGEVTSLAHVNGTVTVAFGSVATAGGATPTWTAATGTCSSVYCHGSTLENATLPDPTWTGGALVCGSCHDLQPTTGGANGHVYHRTAPRAAVCLDCHRGYGEIDLAKHVNGTSEAVLSDGTEYATFEGNCNACHTKLGVP